MAGYSGAAKNLIGRRLAAALCAATLAITAVGGAGAALLAARAHMGHPVAAVRRSEPETRQAARGGSEAGVLVPPSISRPTAVFYVVASDEQRQAIQQAGRFVGFIPAPNAEFVVSPTEDELMALRQEITSESAFLAAAAVPPMALEDVR